MNREIESDLLGKPEKALYKALSDLKTSEQVANFLRDLLTYDEIREAANRLEAARMLSKSVTVREISKKTSMSSATISRINFWLHHGTGGYRLVLKKLKS